MLISRLFSSTGKSGREMKFPGNPGNPGKYKNGQKHNFWIKMWTFFFIKKRLVFVLLLSNNGLLYICDKFWHFFGLLKKGNLFRRDACWLASVQVLEFQDNAIIDFLHQFCIIYESDYRKIMLMYFRKNF